MLRLLMRWFATVTCVGPMHIFGRLRRERNLGLHCGWFGRPTTFFTRGDVPNRLLIGALMEFLLLDDELGGDLFLLLDDGLLLNLIHGGEGG